MAANILPSDLMNPGRCRVRGSMSFGGRMHYLVARQWAKSILQTRMLMVRYAVLLAPPMTEAEARLAWGDR